MSKRVFFSFHYKDVAEFRANVVRNHWRLKPNREISGYYDASIWEAAKKEGEIASKRLINKGLSRTSNTCILIGSETYQRPWVRYEILKSFKKGNHIFCVHINSIKCKGQGIKEKGPNPLKYVGVTFSSSGKTATLWEKVSGKWIKYSKVDGIASYQANIPEQHRGKGFNLSHFYKTYDWVSDDGYNNFSSWVR